jgi:2-polyprenyl-3-methyl-5-hydroxy-6-metoxy-1,4-benzoquinol methylase
MSSLTALSVPDPSSFEHVPCYYCGHHSSREYLTAQDDLTGKPGDFRFVACRQCGLVFQNPRLEVERIKDYYDEEYIAHRKKKNWGVLTGFFNYVMDNLDRQKDRIVRPYVALGPGSEVLDVGCGAGTYLGKVRALYGAAVTGVDFKDMSHGPGLEEIEFHCGLFYEQALEQDRFDLVTMWHFLEHDYDPMRSLQNARRVMKPEGRLVVEVPRLDSLTFRLYRGRWPGLQAPQHTALYTREMLLKFVAKAGLEEVDYLPYGAFPAYFYLFAGAAFKMLRGRGLNLSKAIYPYFLGQLLLAPLLLFERRLNLAMQTIVCSRSS